VLIEGRSRRAVAKELGISRLTVRKYVEQAAPVRVEKEPRARPIWTKVHERLEALLETAPAWTDKKQQLAARRAATVQPMKDPCGHRPFTLVQSCTARPRPATIAFRLRTSDGPAALAHVHPGE